MFLVAALRIRCSCSTAPFVGGVVEHSRTTPLLADVSRLHYGCHGAIYHISSGHSAGECLWCVRVHR